MTNEDDREHRAILQRIARRAMLERGLLPDFSAAALAELAGIGAPARADFQGLPDLRDMLWASIDNNDTRDLDQLSVAAAMPGGSIKVFVAVADVDATVKKGSAIDLHACHNTTSVYTAAATFPMLPDKLSTGLTSLNLNEDRPAIVIEMTIAEDGSVVDSNISRALVRNHAQLAYGSVAAWLEGGAVPAAIAAVPGLDENLRLQEKATQGMKKLRQVHGALTLESLEARPIFVGDEIRGLDLEQSNRAKRIIEDLMIAANGVTVRYLSAKGSLSLRRVVRIPEHWDRLVELAGEHGFKLPAAPDSRALEQFLVQQQAADPLRFPDLSLAVIKLIGRGEYLAQLPEDTDASGHFGLAVADYTHSTAPNRRYPDIIMQRLVKSALARQPAPYDKEELVALARHCTDEEDAAKKVERQVSKSAAALLLQSRIGEQFEAIVTGAGPKGTWVRVLNPPVEGKLMEGFEGMGIGRRMRVQLLSTDVDRGFIDFRGVV